MLCMQFKVTQVMNVGTFDDLSHTLITLEQMKDFQNSNGYPFLNTKIEYQV